MRNNILAQNLQGYLDGTTAVERDDCAADIGHICALAEEGLAALEATGGDANIAFNTNSDSNDKDQESYKSGEDCYARDCKWPHSKKHNPAAAWKKQQNRCTKDKGGKTSKGGNRSKGRKCRKGCAGKQRCNQQGCQEHQKQAYCNAHYRQLQEQSSAKISRKEKRAAKVDLESETKRAAKASKAELLEDLLLQVIAKVIPCQGYYFQRFSSRWI